MTGPAAGADGTPPRAPARRRPLLAALLVLVIAAAIALVLAQSAGAIHLSMLGGTGA